MGNLVLDAVGNEIVLPALWRDRRCVLVFLRHFGCRLCKQHVSLMKALKAEYEVHFARRGALPQADGFDGAADIGSTTFILVGIGTPSHIEEFCQETGWTGELYVVPDVKNTSGGVYGTFQLHDGMDRVGRDSRVMGPGGTGEAALAQGFMDGGYSHVDGGYLNGPEWVSMPEYAGNIGQLGGVFIVGPGNTCDYSFRSDYAGHFPDAADILGLIAPSSNAQLVAVDTEVWAERLSITEVAKCPFGKPLVVVTSLSAWDAMAMGAAAIAVIGLARRNRLLGLGGSAMALGMRLTPNLMKKAMGAVGVALIALARRKRLLGLKGSAMALFTRVWAVLMKKKALDPGELHLLTAKQIDDEVIRYPSSVACDCGFVPKIQMGRARTETEHGRVDREVGSVSGQVDLDVLATWLCYARGFLAKAHPQVGRGGPVCPFVPKALMLDSMYLSVSRVSTFDEVEREVMAAKAKFNSLAPTEGSLRFFRTVILIFPEVKIAQAHDIIDGVQDRLKNLFVKDGLMLGEFHLMNNATGLRNPNFYPLRTPYPTLALRHMVPSDLPFLKAKKEWTQAYLQQFDSAENFKKAKDDLRQEAELALCD